MKPQRVIHERAQSAPATCQAWQYRDFGPVSYVRCDTPLYLEVTSKRIIVVCPWHPDKITKVLPEEQPEQRETWRW